MKGALLRNDIFYFFDTLNTFCWNFYLNYILNAGLLLVMQYLTLWYCRTLYKDYFLLSLMDLTMHLIDSYMY